MDRADGFLLASVQRYWYDVDNRYVPLLALPMATVGYVRDHDASLADLRAPDRNYTGKLQMPTDLPVAFEYSSCFPAEQIRRKLDTQSHVGHTPAELRQSLRANHRPASAQRATSVELGDRWMFQTVPLTEDNSPRYVRENLDRLRTGVVDPDYEQHRRTDYPELYRWSGRALGYARRITSRARARGPALVREAARRARRRRGPGA
jgi:hypothetical protein